ncbi:LEM domain-containing protein 1 isoform X2 [Varanus komodoensis]|uniref:LEM domain-containing protein 1 isoform X2 n=1 Tax=Varanus komodoensis TaxID=61221 RepID=UPI001CF7AB02|nr:LEM domain-containing protein 1 isoform X2 [Varanus komodoensis]
MANHFFRTGQSMPASTRTTYEKKLLQLMKQCPTIAAGSKRLAESDLEKDEKKGLTTEVVLQTNNLKVTAECASGLDNKPVRDVEERQKKLLSPDAENSLAKIVAELQEILPEGKVALQRSPGVRRKAGGSPENNYRKKRSGAPPIDYGYPDANSVGQSTRRRTVREDPPPKQGPDTKCMAVPVYPRVDRIPMRVKIAVFAIFIFLLLVYVTMETNLENPFTTFIMHK